MNFNLIHIFKSMDVFALSIVACLLIMALASMAVFFERLYVYARSRRQSQRFGARAAALLGKNEHGKLLVEAEAFRGSHLAKLVAAGMKSYLGAQEKPGDVAPLELTKRELVRKTEAVSADVRRGMNVLASVGSVAPFVGLLGTVVGIIAAFQGIAKEGSGGLGAVSAGIAEALIVTALGLVVAIPSVLAFNFLNARADKLLLALDQSRGELVDYLENTGNGPVRGEPYRPTPGHTTEPAHVEARASASA
jgi:biopolymer transport protein ExbB